ncbi:MAG: helix-turn-helix transcriptional regulator [Anaerolineales bacterium]|nr:helix-turn-helix transcriptional regulator [Anaerolineales bacterium]
MQYDLWQLRQQKRLTINKLAAKSGVPALSIFEYEQGQAVRDADLPKLAQALEVEPEELKQRSVPNPRKPGSAAKQQKAPAKGKPKPKPKPARSSQVEHLLALATKFNKSKEDLEEDMGMPLESLSVNEMGELLKEYTQKIKDRKEKISSDPSGTKRWRSHLPEGVDGFEIDYLTRQQKEKNILLFTLFDKQQFKGRIIGFSPYNITIRTTEGQEVTLQKLALAYYSVESGGEGVS